MKRTRKTLKNSSRRALLALAMGASLLFVACGESEQSITSQAPATVTSGSYADVAPIITQRCAICHIGGGTQPELGGLANMTEHGWEAYRVMENGAMPPGGPRISTEELSRLHAWLVADSIPESVRRR